MTSQRFFIKSDKKVPEVASVAVLNGDKILMGKRKDTELWTLPGGHLDPGEEHRDAAQREVYEETGIGLTPSKFKFKGSETVDCLDGKKRIIHAYVVKYSGPTTVRNDPDEEVYRWRWVDKNNIPDEIINNLHSKKNVVFKFLGIKEPIKKSFVIDLVKGVGGTKYLRKYQRNGKWVYIYHEAGQRPRRIDEEAVKIIHKLKEHGDKHAHKLVESTEEYHPEKLEILRKLAHHGDTEAIKHLKEEMGIDYKAEATEDKLLARKNENPMNKQLDEEKKKKIHAAIDHGIKKGMTNHLYGSYSTSAPTKALKERGFNGHEDFSNRVTGNTLSEKLHSLHSVMREVDSAHEGVRSQNSEANNAGGYGNLTYKRTIEKLISDGHLPEGYDEVHSRDKDKETLEHPNPKKIQEEKERAQREAAEKRQREEAEAAERLRAEHESLFETHGESMADMLAYFDQTLNDEQRVNLMKNIDSFFGKDFKWKNFVSSMQGHADVEIKIGDSFFTTLIGHYRSKINFTFYLHERSSGRKITYASRSIIKLPNGGIKWYNSVFNRPPLNDDLKKYPGMASGMYGGVYKFLKELTANYSDAAKEESHIYISQAANSGFSDRGYKGALVWAKHHFDFSSSSQASSWKRTWKGYINKYATRLSLSSEEKKDLLEKVDKCKYPYEFVRMGFPLTKEQALKATGKRTLDWDFDQIFERKGHCDIGELLLIHYGDETGGGDWVARADLWKSSARNNHLAAKRDVMYGRQDAGGGVGSSAGKSQHEIEVENFLKVTWKPSGSNTNIAVTAKRIRDMKTWPKEQVKVFLQKAPLTRDGKRKVKEIYEGLD